MLVAARLAWRMQRWEANFLVGGSLVLAVVMAVVAWQLTITREALTACIGDSAGGPMSADCRSLVDWGNLLTFAGEILPTIALGIPFVVGILLGAPLVAREIEKRTAPIAWSLSRSRARWLGGRLVPILIVVALALLAVGTASEALLRAARPDSPLGFANLGFHGPLIAVRGLAVLIVGVAVGLLLGRVLPAILLTGLLTIALLGGLTLVRSEMMRAEATWVAVPADGGSFNTIYDSGWTDDATGEFVTYDQAFERFPEEFGPEGSWMPPGLTQLYLATPPELYPSFVAREMAALVGLATILGAAAAWVVTWRRPA